jgi:HSP20 family protein
MLLTSFDPFTREFDRFAQRAFGTAHGTVALGQSAMPMDVIKREDEVELRFDLPGADAESIDVTVDRGLLTVSAQRAEEKKDEGETLISRERITGSFTRRVRLSDSVDTENIGAAYTDGVLTVRLPLVEKARPRKVEIRTSDQKKIAA